MIGMEFFILSILCALVAILLIVMSIMMTIIMTLNLFFRQFCTLVLYLVIERGTKPGRLLGGMESYVLGMFIRVVCDVEYVESVLLVRVIFIVFVRTAEEVICFL